jgi:uncharacterized membrane protein
MRKFNRVQVTAMASMLAAVYAVVTLYASFVVPQYEAIQLRFADSLEVLVFFLGWPAVIGLSLGCLVANVFSPYELLDVTWGTFSTVVSTLFVMYIGKKSKIESFQRNLFLAMVLSSIIIGLMIGSLLTFYGAPFLFSAGAVTVGQLVVKVVIGYPLGLALPKFMPSVFHVEGLKAEKTER